MLSPFHIRDLRRPSSLPQPSLGGASTPFYDALVCMTAPEYDSTISVNPDAKLKYVDEDDGEVVTVGSSLELSQRLSEPVLPSSRKDYHKLRAVPSSSGIFGSSYHMFEIERTANAVCVWLRIDVNYHLTQLLQGFNLPEAVLRAEAANAGSESLRTAQVTFPDSLSVEAIDTSVEDSRRLHSERRVPDDPDVHVDALDDGSRTQEMVSILVGIANTENSGLVHAKNNTTLKGKRQALPAGEKSRNRTITGRHIAGKSSNLTPVNRWGSYNDVNTVSMKPFLGSSVSATLTSEGKRQAQAAGDRLRTRTNPMRHAKPSRIESGVSKNRWPAYSGSRPLRFDDRISSIITTDTAQASLEPKNQYGADQRLLSMFEAEIAKLDAGTTKPLTDEKVAVSKQHNGSSSISPRPAPAHIHLAAVLQSLDALRGFIKAVKVFADIAEKMGSELKDPLAEVVAVLDENTPEVLALSDYFLQLAFSEGQKEMRADVVPADASSQAQTKVSTHNTTVSLSPQNNAISKANRGPTDDGYYVGAQAPTLGSKNAPHISSQDIHQRKHDTRSRLKQKAVTESRVEPSISNLLNPDTNSSHLLRPSPATNIPYKLSKKQGNLSSATPNDDSHHSNSPVPRSSYHQHPISYPFAESCNPSSTSPRNPLPYPSLNQPSPSSTRLAPVPTIRGHRRHPEGEAIRQDVPPFDLQRTSKAIDRFLNTAIPGARALRDSLSFAAFPSMEAVQASRPHNAARNVPDSMTDPFRSPSTGASGFLPFNRNAATGVSFGMGSKPSENVQSSTTDLSKRISTRTSGFLTENRPVVSGRESEPSEPSEPSQLYHFDLVAWKCRGDEPPINKVLQLKEHTENLTLFNKEDVQIHPANGAVFNTSPSRSPTAGELLETNNELEEFREEWLKEISDEKSTSNGNLLTPPSHPGQLVSENGTMRRPSEVSAKLRNTSSLQAPSPPPVLDIDMPFHREQAFAEHDKAEAGAKAKVKVDYEAKYYAEAKAKADALAKSAPSRKIKECARWLKDMGFRCGATDRTAMLMNIAEVAKGNVSDAIDMLQEEREAYKEILKVMENKENARPSS